MTSARLDDLRMSGYLAPPMRNFVSWFVVGALLSASASYVLRASEPVRVPVVEGVEATPVAVRIPYAEPLPEAPVEDPRDWCEPIDPPPCLVDDHCSPAPDGTRRVCVREWWVEGSGERVCVTRAPSKRVQSWRAARLRVIVDAVCKRGDGCDPAALHGYLSALALRESSWRPYAVHRLAGDREAASIAWRKMADNYVDSPAHGEPWRWQGYGLYGQNSAYLLAQWDATAVPEVLCGEVEATLVHLRTARDRWRRLARGVTCEGAAHRGTGKGGEPSWYDVSLVNSGSDPCPGNAKVREGFERRARSRGLEPYAAVTLRMLGREVPRDEQGAFAAKVRRRMDRSHPSP